METISNILDTITSLEDLYAIKEKIDKRIEEIISEDLPIQTVSESHTIQEQQEDIQENVEQSSNESSFEVQLNVLAEDLQDYDKSLLLTQEIEARNHAVFYTMIETLEKERDIPDSTLFKIFGILTELGRIMQERLFTILIEQGIMNWIIQALTEKKDDAILLEVLNLLSKLCYCVQLPPSEHRKLDNDLIEFLVVECALSRVDVIDETIFDAALQCIFCVNLQFVYSKRNTVLEVFSQVLEATRLGNSIIALLNRGDNEYHIRPCLQFIKGLLCHPDLSDFFFTNDLSVLVEVIIRELSDLPEESPLIPHYLDMLYAFLKNYPDHNSWQNKKEDISYLIGRILEYHPSGGYNFNVAEKIVYEFPSLSA